MIKSENYYRRKELMKSLEMPTMTDIINQMGEPLANVLFNRCPNALRKEIGLEPPLLGPGDELWTSPSDLLKEIKVLKPPPNQKCISALTHEGIIILGKKVETKFSNEIGADKLNTLAYHKQEFLETVEKRYEEVTEGVKMETEAMYNERLQKLTDAFEKYLSDQLVKLEQNLRERYEHMLESSKEQHQRTWQERFDEAIDEVVTNITKKFVDDLEHQEKELKEHFEKQQKLQQLTSGIIFEEEQRRCKRTLKSLQHNLECKNIANMMYVMCIERKKCQKEREIMDKQCRTRLKELENIIINREVALKIAIEQKMLTLRKLNLREESICKILMHFQKFIQIAFRLTPFRSEFLLNLEKILTLELAQALVAADPVCSKHLVDTLLAWKKDRTSLSSIISMKDDENIAESIIWDQPISATPSVASVTPAIFYKKGLYIREDFTDVLLQDLELSPSNILWNKDVRHLIRIFRKKSDLTSEIIDAQEYAKLKRTRSQQSAHSSVHFGKPDDQQSIMTGTGVGLHRKVRSIISTSLHENEKLLDKVQYSTEDSLGLLCTKDSLTKHRESLLSSTKPGSGHSHEVQVEKKMCKNKKPHEQIIKSIKPFVSEPKSEAVAEKGDIEGTIITILQDISVKNIEEDGTRKNSRLSLAKDSLILRKLSLGIDRGENADSNIPVTAPIAEEIDETSDKIALEKVKEQLNKANKNFFLGGALDSQRSLDAKLLHTKLSSHQDSLEIIREQQTSKASVNNSVDIIIGQHDPLIPTHSNDRLSVVTFFSFPKVYGTDSYNYSDSPWMVYHKKSQNLLEIPVIEKEKVLLSHNLVEVNETEVSEKSDAHIHNIDSLIDLLKSDYSLMKLFTGCIR